MKIKATLDDVYVPEWNGNRDLPETEQVSVEIKWPTTEQRESLKSIKFTKDQDVTFTFNTRLILNEHIGKISNLEVSLNGKPVKIDTGKDLAGTRVLALQGLIDELKRVVANEDGLEEEQAKN